MTDADNNAIQAFENSLPALNNIRVVLINTFDPGNIGACVRAMKTMGLTDLVLVNPIDYPSSVATARAAGAQDLLEKAKVVTSFEAAIADCTLIIGTSAKTRIHVRPFYTPRTAAAALVSEARTHQVALVMGCERSGLSNDQMRLCHYCVSIDGNPHYNVLNIGNALQILCYEIFNEAAESKNSVTDVAVINHTPQHFSQSKDLQNFYQRLETLLTKLEYIRPNRPSRTMERIKKLFDRTRVEKKELRLLQGLITRFDEKTDLSNKP